MCNLLKIFFLLEELISNLINSYILIHTLYKIHAFYIIKININIFEYMDCILIIDIFILKLLKFNLEIEIKKSYKLKGTCHMWLKRNIWIKIKDGYD